MIEGLLAIPAVRSAILWVAGAALVVGGVWYYGHVQYQRGATETRTTMQAQAQALAQAAQEQRDKADAQYRGRLLATQATQQRVAADLADTSRMLRTLRGRLQAAGTCPRLDDAGEDWIGILGASWARYQAMANEAGRLADKVTGLQGYINALPKPKDK